MRSLSFGFSYPHLGVPVSKFTLFIASLDRRSSYVEGAMKELFWRVDRLRRT